METKSHLLNCLTATSILFAAITRLHAQGTFIGGQALDITFSATSGSATNQPSGGASCFQVGY
ncbi:MAG: hypothetical protein ACREFE_08900 [Limisphaerales bacterium]